MSKNKQKKEYASYNPAIIKKLKEKYGLSTQFIGASLRGDRTSDTSTEICKDYKIMEQEINKSLENL
jgi:hypothetical protein